MAKLIGVVNVTEDSFSDGGRFLDPDDAIAHARRLAGEGADVVEVGAASSHPDARHVPPGVEIDRLAPVVSALVDDGVPVAVDSCRVETQRWALTRGVDILNDVRGFPDPAIYPALAAAPGRLVVMHSIRQAERATRDRTEPGRVVGDLFDFFTKRIAGLEAAGIARERLILDPGMGFFLGSDPGPSVEVLRSLGALRRHFGLATLVSVSRKSFLAALTGRPTAELGGATLAAEIFAAADARVDWIRTHDVGALRDALRVLEALRREPPSGAGGDSRE